MCVGPSREPSLMCLTTGAAGEGWRQLMNDCKLTGPHCTPRPADGRPSDCGFQVCSAAQILSAHSGSWCPECTAHTYMLWLGMCFATTFAMLCWSSCHAALHQCIHDVRRLLSRQVGATIYFCSFLVVASNVIMALFLAVSAEYVSYDLVVSDTALVTVGHLQQFQVCPLQQVASASP
jgi:hypothetical protein